MVMAERNFENRTIYHGDNLDFLIGLNTGTIDLIATDPPFNKKKDFHATEDSLAAGAKFTDRWSWEDDTHAWWVAEIENEYPAIHATIQAARTTYGNDMAAFLCWLSARLFECHRVLKPTGSMYLHIDHTAHAYVKMLMDAIFGQKNFRNEIVWCYNKWSNTASYFQRNHDTILFYTKSDVWTFNKPLGEMTPGMKAIRERGYNGGTQHGRPLLRVYDRNNPKAQAQINSGKYDADRIYYIDNPADGAPIPDYWTDIPILKGKEKNGFPTQKPLSLYQRILEASSNPGDWVLDPFCGCATTPVIAEVLGRNWIGMDIWSGARGMVIQRLEESVLTLFNPEAKVIYKTVPEERDEEIYDEPLPNLELSTKGGTVLQPWQRIKKAEIKNALCKAQHHEKGTVLCAGCGRDLEPVYLQIDHIRPRSENGKNTIDNFVLLCGPCNLAKRNKFTVRGLWSENKTSGHMKDDSRAKTAYGAATEYADLIEKNFGSERVKRLLSGEEFARVSRGRN